MPFQQEYDTMMSISEIRDYHREAAGKASQEKMVPLMIWPEDVGNIDTLGSIPVLGDHVPEGWEELLSLEDGRPVRHFVDSSGFGDEEEPAETIQHFADNLKPGTAYALVEVGQFQVYVGEFKKVKNRG
jgi:hypothetical protein